MSDDLYNNVLLGCRNNIEYQTTGVLKDGKNNVVK